MILLKVSSSKGIEFESEHRILDGLFFTFICGEKCVYCLFDHYGDIIGGNTAFYNSTNILNSQQYKTIHSESISIQDRLNVSDNVSRHLNSTCSDWSHSTRRSEPNTSHISQMSAIPILIRPIVWVLGSSRTSSSRCYKSFFGGNLENLDFPLSWNNKNKPF